MARSKGEGTVYQRDDGLWVGRIELPSHDGTRRRRQVTAAKKSDLLKKIAVKRKELQEVGDLPTASMSVGKWLDYWMTNVAVKTRRPKTISSYKSNLAWVRRGIGTVRLDKVSGEHIRRVHRVMDKAGKSSTYQRNTHSVMSAVFGDAEREGRIPRNPVDLIDAPLRAIPQLEVLTPDEARSLIATFEDTPDAYLWATFMLTGARRGEILGLEWDRVGEALDLSWQLQRIGQDAELPADYERRPIQGGLWWTRPKSRAGWRELPLVDPLAGILARWKEIAPDNPWGLVFTRQTAAGPVPLDPDWASREWPKVLAAAGIEKNVRLHDLRHGAVDLLYESGVPEDLIQEIVGHSTRAMSRAYKSRGNRTRTTDAMKQMSTLLGYGELEK